jgi:hypothetical protein
MVCVHLNTREILRVIRKVTRYKRRFSPYVNSQLGVNVLMKSLMKSLRSTLANNCLHRAKPNGTKAITQRRYVGRFACKMIVFFDGVPSSSVVAAELWSR